VQLLILGAFEYLEDLGLLGIGKAGQQWPEQGCMVVHDKPPNAQKGRCGARG
jgi:hypothetical protein